MTSLTVAVLFDRSVISHTQLRDLLQNVKMSLHLIYACLNERHLHSKNTESEESKNLPA